MQALCAPKDHLDFPMLAADALVDTGLFDAILEGLFQAILAVPAKLAAFLGPELRTRENSQPPAITFSEPGPWNGLIFIEADEASFWLIAKAGPGRRGFGGPRPSPVFSSTRQWSSDPHPPRDDSFGDPNEQDSWRR